MATPELADLTTWERMLADYATTSVSIDVHPLTLLRRTCRTTCSRATG